MDQRMKINLNDKIKVKLTEGAIRILHSHYAAFEKFPTPPKQNLPDQNGISEFQLWEFMQVFGHKMYLGGPPVIEDCLMEIHEKVSIEHESKPWEKPFPIPEDSDYSRAVKKALDELDESRIKIFPNKEEAEKYSDSVFGSLKNQSSKMVGRDFQKRILDEIEAITIEPGIPYAISGKAIQVNHAYLKSIQDRIEIFRNSYKENPPNILFRAWQKIKSWFTPKEKMPLQPADLVVENFKPNWNWQPFHTLPKDYESEVLLYWPPESLGKEYRVELCESIEDSLFFEPPTHWCPIELPKDKT
jgi:hypothetical protein